MQLPSLSHVVCAVATSLALASCGQVSYIKSEMSGTAKPMGGIQDVIPVTRTYTRAPDAIRRAAIAVLEEQGYIVQQEPGTGGIRTEARVLPNSSNTIVVQYSARAFVTLDGQNVSYRARFDKKSSVVQAETGLEFVEKENELRRDFFAALDKRLPQ